MRTFKSLLALIAMLLCGTNLFAHDFVVDGIYYKITDATNKTVAVSYRGTTSNSYSNEYTGSIVIPQNVTYNSITYSVTSIADHAFTDCSAMTDIEIPNSIITIGVGSFENCTGLTEVVIPNSVTHIGTIGWSNSSYGAFEGCINIENIEIPNSVVIIGESAFRNCEKLEEIEIPSGVTMVGTGAFHNTEWFNQQPEGLVYIDHVLYCYKGEIPADTNIEIKEGTKVIAEYAFAYGVYSYGCNLSSVTIPSSVTHIGRCAFFCSIKLTQIIIPENVISIENQAFGGCSNLQVVVNCSNLTFEKGSSNHGNIAELADKVINNAIIVDGFVFEKYEKQLLHYLGSNKNITLPSDFNSEKYDIGENAFYNNKELESIIISDGVTSIGNNAFQSCSALTSVTIGNSVTSIGSCTFQRCSNLTDIVLPNSLTQIGEHSFYECSSLTSIEIPNSVTSIGMHAFNSSGLESIEIPNSITSLGTGVFAQCFSLKNVVLPESLINLGEYGSSEEGPFCSCTSLTQITLPKKIKIIGGCAFTSSGLVSIDIPESVTKIGDAAFLGCNNLQSVIIPQSVKEISSSAFAYCQLLTEVTCYIPAENLFEPYYGCFEGINENCVLTVPYGAKSTYEATEGWNVFKEIVEMADITLVDGGDFSNAEDLDANNITYTRNLPNLHWNALYVPFKIPYATLADDYEVAYINAVHSYDNDDNGTIDELSMEVMKIKAGTLKANYPYLIKARNEAAKAMTISVADAVLYAAEENTLDCSSVYQKFEITGSYSRKSAEDLEGNLAISTEGAWQPLATGTYLNPFRLYLTITNRDDSPVEVEPTALSRVRIIENGETTGILDLTPAVKKETHIFDLSGRRVLTPQRGQLYIVNGKKVVY